MNFSRELKITKESKRKFRNTRNKIKNSIAWLYQPIKYMEENISELKGQKKITTLKHEQEKGKYRQKNQ